MSKKERKIFYKDILLPGDAGPHPESNIEWWYYYALLKGSKGGKYTTMGSFFRVGELECCKGHYFIFSVTDLNRNIHRAYSFVDCKTILYLLFIYLPYHLFKHPMDTKMWKIYLDLLSMKLPAPHRKMTFTTVLNSPTSLLYGKSSLHFINDREEQFQVHTVGNGTDANLQFCPEKPLSLIGGTGKPNNLFYYSFTRNKVTGSIKFGKAVEDVTGTGWFDHQWGKDHKLTLETGWNWFGLQLEDRRELLINNFLSISEGDTFTPMANLIQEDGSLKFTRNLEFQVLEYWESPSTKAMYPLKWAISIPDFHMQMTVCAGFPGQEMPVIGPLQAIWEGVCSVSGQEMLPGREAKPLQGKGFMELVGYANSSNKN